MDEFIFMAITHCFNYLSEIDLRFVFREFPLLFHQLKQFTAFKILHHEHNPHIAQSEAIYYFYNILVVQRFHDFSLSEDHVNVLSVTFR
jgi:hypothetical protein